MYVCVCTCVCICVCVCEYGVYVMLLSMHAQAYGEETRKLVTGAGVPSGCEEPHMGARS